MRRESPGQRPVRGWTGVAAAAILLSGVALRVSGWLDAPPGPWVDEAYAVRASRAVRALESAPFFGTTPLEPPEAGFVNSWLTNPYLLATSVLDRAAGGGMKSIRLLSVAPAILLLLAAALLAAELLKERAGPFLVSLAFLASSSWLLTTGRWGWNAVSTSLLLVLSATSVVRAGRLRSARWSVAGGVFLGLAQYGYLAAWLAAPVPVFLLAGALARRARCREKDGEVRRGFVLLAATALVALPLATHMARHPERAGARAAEIGVWRSPPGTRATTFATGLARNARLFVSGGDPNLRHGSPESPVLPPLAVVLALAGLGAALSRGGESRVAFLFAALLLCGGVLTYEAGGPNSYRISPAAPFLLVLCGVGSAWFLDLLAGNGRRVAAVALSAGIALTAAAEIRFFTGWLATPALFGWFGGPERELADAIDREKARGPAETVLDPQACRNPVVVEVLVASPDRGSERALVIAPRGPDGLPNVAAPPRSAPSDLLWAVPDGVSSRAAVALLRGDIRALGTPLPGFGRWILARIPRAAPRATAGPDAGR